MNARKKERFIYKIYNSFENLKYIKKSLGKVGKIDELISLGYKPNEAIKEVSRLCKINRQELYKNYIDYKKG